LVRKHEIVNSLGYKIRLGNQHSCTNQVTDPFTKEVDNKDECKSQN